MIEVEELTKVYVDTAVVDDLSFFVPEGQVLGFLGPNGAGKTTTMRMITALPAADDGTGRRGRGRPRRATRSACGARSATCPRTSRSTPRCGSRSTCAFAPRWRRSRGKEVAGAGRRGRASDACSTDVRRQVIGTLSKGYRQRVGLAGALIHQPPVLDSRRAHGRPRPEPDHQDPRADRRARPGPHGDPVDPHPARGRAGVRAGAHHRPRPDRGRRHARALRARMMGNPRLEVELVGANGDGTRRLVSAAGGRHGVTRSGHGYYRVEHTPETDPREAIFRLAVERGWVLTDPGADPRLAGGRLRPADHPRRGPEPAEEV